MAKQEILQEGSFVRLKSGTEGWVKGQIVECFDLIPSVGGMIYAGPGYKIHVLEGKHKGETIRVPANYVEPYTGPAQTQKEPLYPHVPKSQQPLFPHVPGGRPTEEMVRREGDWVYAKVGTTEVRGKKVPAGIAFEQVSPTYDRKDFNKAVLIIEKSFGGQHLLPVTPEVTKEVVKIKQGIQDAVAEHPYRLEHAISGKTTGFTGFWITKQGKIYQHDLLKDIPTSERQGLVNVHSHSPVEWEQRLRKGRLDAFDPLGAGDIENLQTSVRNGWSDTMAVIMGDGRMEVLHVPTRFKVGFLRLTKAEIRKALSPTSTEGMRDALKMFAEKHGLEYQTSLSWKSSVAIPKAEVGDFITQDTINYLAKTEGNPVRKFCCRQCGECAPPELLEEGRFPDRIAWLRSHYKANHPGIWGKRQLLPQVLIEGGDPIPDKYRWLRPFIGNEPLPKETA